MARVVLPKKKEVATPTPRHYTSKQLRTKEVLHEILAEYDTIVTEYDSNPSSANKKKKTDYEHHLKSKNQLAVFFLSYISQNGIQDTLVAEGRIREVISLELEDGELVMVDGLIRSSKTVPRDNVSSTGNTITIVLPERHVDNMVDILKKALVNESARIIVPCNNMIIVIETGEFTNVINDGLYHTVCEVVTTYTCNDYFLKPQKPSPSIKIVIN